MRKKISYSRLPLEAKQELQLLDDFLAAIQGRDLPRLQKEVRIVARKLASQGIKIFHHSQRMKTRDDVLDKIVRLNLNSDAGRLNRPVPRRRNFGGRALHNLSEGGFTVGHINDIIGFRLVIEHEGDYFRASQIIINYFNKRLLYYYNYYFIPAISRRYPFRVIVFTIRYKNYCYEIQLISLADSIWADLYHETWYKRALRYSKQELECLEVIGRYQTLNHTRSLLSVCS